MRRRAAQIGVTLSYLPPAVEHELLQDETLADLSNAS